MDDVSLGVGGLQRRPRCRRSHSSSSEEGEEGPGRTDQDYKIWEGVVGVEVRHPTEWLRLVWTSASSPIGDNFSIAGVQIANKCPTQLVHTMTSYCHVMTSSCTPVLRMREELVEVEEKVVADDAPCL